VGESKTPHARVDAVTIAPTKPISSRRIIPPLIVCERGSIPALVEGAAYRPEDLPTLAGPSNRLATRSLQQMRRPIGDSDLASSSESADNPPILQRPIILGSPEIALVTVSPSEVVMKRWLTRVVVVLALVGGALAVEAQGVLLPRIVAAAQKQDPQTITVYVTRTGAKYHRDGCRYLSRSKIPMSLAEASKRFAPCKVCKPPTLR
jgi:hypothetical protein